VAGAVIPSSAETAMKRSYPWKAVACALLVLSLGDRPAAAESAAEVTRRGQRIVEKLCARCHAIRATGNSPLALAPPFRDLHKKYPLEALAEPLAEGIVTGHKGMPVFEFAAGDVDAILRYLDHLAPKTAPGK
jgi:cytochrome c